MYTRDALLPTTLVVNTLPYSQHYFATILRPLQIASPSRFTERVLDALYHQSCLEIFDCMEADFQQYQQRLSHRPDFTLFLEADYFETTPTAKQIFQLGLCQFGHQIYTVLSSLGLISLQSILVLNHVDRDWFIVEYHEEPVE